jgi:hypothetical protein
MSNYRNICRQIERGNLRISHSLTENRGYTALETRAKGHSIRKWIPYQSVFTDELYKHLEMRERLRKRRKPKKTEHIHKPNPEQKPSVKDPKKTVLMHKRQSVFSKLMEWFINIFK